MMTSENELVNNVMHISKGTDHDESKEMEGSFQDFEISDEAFAAMEHWVSEFVSQGK